MASALLDHQLTVPDEHTATQAAEAVAVLERFLRQHPELADVPVSLQANDVGTVVPLPGHAPRLLADLLAYKRVDDAERRAIADELTAEAQRIGLDY